MPQHESECTLMLLSVSVRYSVLYNRHSHSFRKHADVYCIRIADHHEISLKTFLAFDNVSFTFRLLSASVSLGVAGVVTQESLLTMVGITNGALFELLSVVNTVGSQHVTVRTDQHTPIVSSAANACRFVNVM